MKKNYFNFLIFGIICLTLYLGQSQNILFDGYFSVSKEIIPLDTPPPSIANLDDIKLQDLSSATQDKVVIVGTFQKALNCENDWDPNCDNIELTLNSSTGLYTGTFFIPEGSNRYKVIVGNSWEINYGENGIFNGADIFLCVASGSEEITFTYDPSTNLVTTSPVTSGFSPDCLPLVVLTGSFQDEIGCYSDWAPDCTNTALTYNPGTGLFEGAFSIPTGCYEYRVVLDNNWHNNFGQGGIHNGSNYAIFIPANPSITHFTYDPVSHMVSSTPYSEPPQEVTEVALIGTLQDELGCGYDNDFYCDNPALLFNPDSDFWEASFILPAGCYTYRVRETLGCNVTIYGENGGPWGDEIQLYVPTDGEITFIYDPDTHIVTSTPYNIPPQEVTTVSLFGTFQNEIGCSYDYDYECNIPALLFDANSGTWKGSVTLPAGCYTYYVKEIFGCNIVTLYGENGIEWGNSIQLYVPAEGEIVFSYDPQTHVISSTPNVLPPQVVTNVSLIGSLQDELGCTYDNYFECDNPALIFNSDSGVWKGSFILPAGCYTYRVKETFGCTLSVFGENGTEWGPEIQLYVPIDSEITFIYDPQTHIISSMPYSEAPQEVRAVSLLGNLQDELGCTYDYDYECEKPELIFNPDTGEWEGSFMLSAGCYFYRVKETFGCIVSYYGENGSQWGPEIQLYVPEDGEITFSYDPITRVISSTPYSGAAQEVIAVSLTGTFQDELGCFYDYDFECNSPELLLNPVSGAWEGSFTLPAGCYTYIVKETSTCNITFYGERGIEWGNEIQLYVPSEGEVTFSYDPLTNIISSKPYGIAPPSSVSLIGTLQDELGCAYDYEYECAIPALIYNPDSDVWEGSFWIPAGCYSYRVKETTVCNETLYGENGNEWGNEIQLFVPTDGEITFTYDPRTHILRSTPYTDLSIVNKCPENIYANNSQGLCGAIVNYPEFSVTANCGGEIVSIIQTEGLSSGSLFPVGTTTNTFWLTTISGDQLTCSFDVVVTDTESPVIAGLKQSYETLWPPNHKMVPLFIDYAVTDNCSIASTVLSISSNEPVNGPGDGNTTPDWEILDEHNVLLRAERSGKGNGREYYITIKVTDDSGNYTEQLVTVKIPHDNGKKAQEIFESDLSNDKYTLYPNGVDDIINLKGPKSTSNSSYVIYDMLGLIKKQGIINNDQIEVSTLLQGIYILKFETDNEYVFKKFIKN